MSNTMSMDQQFEQLEEQVQEIRTEMKSSLTQVVKQLSDNDKKLDNITYFLVGSELEPSSGLVLRVRELELRVRDAELKYAANTEMRSMKDDLDKLKKKIDRAVWIGVGMGIPAGVGVWELIKNWITKI